ncbi:RNA polymerase sigma factor [Wenyingzhuangia sp. IMCC45574]
MTNSASNNSLLNEISNGNYQAFKKVYDTYSKEMYYYGLKILDDKEVCEDLIQNIFIDLWSKRESLKVKNLKGYLFQSVKYQIFNHLRSKKITKEDLTRLNLIDVSMNAAQKMEYHELEEKIKTIIESELPQRCKQIFILSRFEHKTNQEIANELGITMQAVKNQISKGIQKIKLSLQAEEIILYSFLLFISF